MSEQGISLDLGQGQTRRFTGLVLDYTGTLSLDGTLLPGVAQRLERLAKDVRITVLTADTFGKAEQQLAGLPVDVRIIETGLDKAGFVTKLGAEHVITIGNGRNDMAMMVLAGLRIAVIGPEGASAELLLVADAVVHNILDALDLITNPLRLKATLRD